MSSLVGRNAAMAVALRAYYDATGSQATKRRGKIIGLAGYAAKPEVWDAFEAEWWRVLADDTERPPCRYLHMREARALEGEFSPDKGWTTERVTRLLHDLINRCFAPYGRVAEVESALIGAACTVDMGAYKQVCLERPHFTEKNPYTLCIDNVLMCAISQLIPPDEGMYLSDMVLQRRSIALVFDRGEKFRRFVDRAWQPYPWHRRPLPMRLVHSVAQEDKESSAAIQAADFLAWHMNRDVASVDGDMAARMMAIFTTRCFTRHYDYAELLQTAERWTKEGGYRPRKGGASK
jgi:hypothetical protein